jgi:hypothetical protein
MIPVAVHDQAREAVRLRPDEAGECFVDGRLCPVSDGLADAAGEKVQIEILLAAGEAPGDDLRLWIIDCGAEWSIPEVLEGDYVTGLRVSEGLLDFRGINPLVTVENASAW